MTDARPLLLLISKVEVESNCWKLDKMRSAALELVKSSVMDLDLIAQLVEAGRRDAQL